LRGDLSEGFGPYKVINTVAGANASEPSAVIRIEWHLGESIDALFGPGNDHYHGGDMSDELAALFSLNLGMRFKAGPENRRFDLDDDPRGRPVAYGADRSIPLLLDAGAKPLIPSLLEPHTLNEASLVESFWQLSPQDAITVVRAARLYQDAVWIADSEPELSWLLLVSAVETAANQWRASEETHRERLHASRPDLEAALERAGGEELLNTIAPLISPYMGATNKFVSFLLQFLPSPPELRPPEFFRISWERRDIKRSLKKVYDKRSRALHGGRPFPYPMCTPPIRWEDGYSELPNVTGALGAQWQREDIPMQLHVFERIARLAISEWWNTLLPPTQAGT
jgi:hypothetical protein